MHEYLRDILVYRYRECKGCTNRTEFTCIKCGFCWSCQWKMEQIEKVELYDNPPGYSQSTVVEEKRPEAKQPLEKISPTIINVINVYGEEAEPICDYLRCHHKLSEHGLKIRKCQCKHPRNSAAGAHSAAFLLSHN